MNTRIGLLFLLLLPLVSQCADVARETNTRTEVLAFADTSSVRIEIEVARAEALRGADVRAEIVSAKGDHILWTGSLGALEVDTEGIGRLERRLENLDTQRWSPSSPNLYNLSVTVGDGTDDAAHQTVRLGFRSFETRDGRFLLNGAPVFLRGNAINPPDRTIPDSLDENRRFVEDYIGYMKSIGVNIIRSTRHSQIWFDVADELGMMYFQGHYGTPQGGSSTDPPDDIAASLEWYREKVFEPLVNHPSVVIYVLANEQASHDIGYLSRGADEVETFLDRMYEGLSAWDRTRVYIGNAGYGLGRSGDVADIHRYWGWYYNSFLSYYTLRDPENYWRGERGQPITISENTGNYTGPDGRYNLVSKSKQPDSQLNWTGHAPDSEQSRRALAHQALVAKNAIEITRRIRAVNPYVAGLMPFSIPFHEWWDISSFADMRPKPVMDQFAVSYSPVLLSWELWTPQVYAGTRVAPIAHVVNDSDERSGLEAVELHYELAGEDGIARVEGRIVIGDVPYYGTKQTTVDLALPDGLPAGVYTLAGRLLSEGEILSQNTLPLFIADPGFAGSGISGSTRTGQYEFAVYDPSGRITSALNRLGIPFSGSIPPDELLPADHVLVTGGSAVDDARTADLLKSFVASGGRVLYLQPDTARAEVAWLPGGIELRTAELDHALVYPGGRPFRNAFAVNPERPDHPVFAGIDRDRLYAWSDYTGWTQEDAGFPEAYPVTHGFVLTDRDALNRTAILANYDHGLEGVALAELFEGKGSVLLSGFGVIERVGLDPIADRLLVNMLHYQASPDEHIAHPLVTEPIIWGDYGSERGLVTGIYSGLLVNTVPVVPEGLEETYPLRVDADGFQFAGAGGGWNTRPAIQYVARGRRPFGPYVFTLGGSVSLPDDHGELGEGRFWLRIPEDRTTMVTRVQNPISDDLDLEIEINGIRHQETVPGNRSVSIETELRESDSALAVVYRGDRRLVLLETDFRRMPATSNP